MRTQVHCDEAMLKDQRSPSLPLQAESEQPAHKRQSQSTWHSEASVAWRMRRTVSTKQPAFHNTASNNP